MGSSFGRYNPFHLAFSKMLTAGRHTLGEPIAHKRRRCCASGNHAHEAANDRAAYRSKPIARQFFPGFKHGAQIELGLCALEG